MENKNSKNKKKGSLYKTCQGRGGGERNVDGGKCERRKRTTGKVLQVGGKWMMRTPQAYITERETARTMST